MPIFKSTDLNVDVTYTLWRFDMQGWLDQYQESMMPHIYASLQGYLGRWVHSLEDGGNLTIPKLLVCMCGILSVIHDNRIHTVHSCISYMSNGHYENELSDFFYGVCSTPHSPYTPGSYSSVLQNDWLML